MAKEVQPLWERRLQRRWPLIAGLAIAFWTATSALAFGLWTVWVWSKDQEKARDQLRSEADRQHYERIVKAKAPFKEKQFELYMETAEVAGKLVSLPRDDPEWAKAYSRFWALEFSVLATVKDPSVSDAMNAFALELRAYKNAPDTAKIEITRGASLELAHTIKSAIQRDWDN